MICVHIRGQKTQAACASKNMTLCGMHECSAAPQAPQQCPTQPPPPPFHPPPPPSQQPSHVARVKVSRLFYLERHVCQRAAL
jgi:hypothetical protein